MSFFHRHRWREVGRTYMPPPSRKFEYEGYSEDTFHQLMFGATTVELVCEECGRVAGSTLIGDRRLPAENAP